MQNNQKQTQAEIVKEPTIPTPEFSELNIEGMEDFAPLKEKAPKKLRFILTFVGAMTCIMLGAIFIQQSQDIRRIATEPDATECDQSPNCIKIDQVINAGSYQTTRIIDFFIIRAGTQSYKYPGSDSSCYSVTIDQRSVNWEKVGADKDCQDVSHVEIWM